MLTPYEVIEYVKDQGGKITNHDLVTYFKPSLQDAEVGKESKILLKTVTSKICFVKKKEGRKFIQLKPQFQNMSAEEINRFCSNEVMEQSTPGQDEEKERHQQEQPQSLEQEERMHCHDNYQEPLQEEGNEHQQDDYQQVLHEEEKQLMQDGHQGLQEEEKQDVFGAGHPPPPPLPHRKFVSSKPPMPFPKNQQVLRKQASSFEINENQTSDSEDEERDKYDADDDLVNFKSKQDAFKSRNRNQLKSVKDLTKDFDDFAEHSELQLSDHFTVNARKKTQDSSALPKHRRQSVKGRGGSSQEVPVVKLDKEGKQWIMAMSRNNHIAVEKMVRERSASVMCSDPWNGYTALHWACKHGNDNLVKFLINETELSPNTRSRGGYTPLMLSAMYNRTATYRWLLDSGKCDPDLRDFSGRKASHYLETNLPHDSQEELESNGVDEGDYGYEVGKRKRIKRKVERGSSFLRDLAQRTSMRGKISEE